VWRTASDATRLRESLDRAFREEIGDGVVCRPYRAAGNASPAVMTRLL
jgi:hypothetical protein